MTAKRFVLALVLAIPLTLATSGAGGSAAHDADVLVALGAGVAGTWETEVEFANLEDRSLSVFAGEQPNPFVCVTAPCGIAYSALPRNGTTRLTTTSGDFGRFTGRLFVGADDAEELPTIRARVVNRARPSQTIELPLFRRSTLVAMNPGVLAFPFRIFSAGEHSNLFVSEIGLSSDLMVTIEAFAFSGERLSSTSRSLAPGETLFVVDVLAQLGVTGISEGQVRVTKTGGGGILWGLLSTVSDDGRVAVAVGRHP
jgi:hypothetical protein